MFYFVVDDYNAMLPEKIDLTFGQESCERFKFFLKITVLKDKWMVNKNAVSSRGQTLKRSQRQESLVRTKRRNLAIRESDLSS